MSGDGATFELLAIEVGKEIDQDVAGDSFEGEFALLGELVKFDEVATIGRGGVGRETLFHARMSEKLSQIGVISISGPPIRRPFRCRASRCRKLPEFPGSGISRSGRYRQEWPPPIRPINTSNWMKNVECTV